jgi:hypothetical protein
MIIINFSFNSGSSRLFSATYFLQQGTANTANSGGDNNAALAAWVSELSETSLEGSMAKMQSKAKLIIGEAIQFEIEFQNLKIRMPNSKWT